MPGCKKRVFIERKTKYSFNLFALWKRTIMWFCISHKRGPLLYPCMLFIRVTLDLHKSDNNNRMIELTEVFSSWFRFIGKTL